MNSTKVWWQSKTVWGAIIALAAGIATLAGIDLDATLQDELAGLIVQALGIAGAILAWAGRARAASTLSWRRP